MSPEAKDPQARQYVRAAREAENGQMKAMVIPDGVGGYTQLFVMSDGENSVDLGTIVKLLIRCDYV